jgi:hypothetical protein
MGQNSDTYNIFGSYFNSVLLKEQTNLVSPEKLEKLKQQRKTETDPVKIENLDRDIKASEEHNKDLELNPWKKRKEGESSLQHLRRKGAEQDRILFGQPASQEDMEGYKSTAVKPDEVVGKTTPLTPEERAYADAAKAKGKNLSDAQVRGMFANEKRIKEAPATQTQAQPATQAQPKGKITVKSTAQELKNATDAEFMELLKSL